MRAACPIVLLACLLAGCPPAAREVPAVPWPDPDAGRRAWVEALGSRDAARVWRMMGPEARARWNDEKDFAPWCERHCAVLAAGAITAPARPTEVIAVGGHTTLLREGAEWRVQRSLESGPATSVLEALRRFVRLLGELCEDEALAEDTRQRLRRLAAHAGRILASGSLPVEPEGKELRVPLESGGHITFVREADGGWHVSSPDPLPGGGLGEAEAP